MWHVWAMMPGEISVKGQEAVEDGKLHRQGHSCVHHGPSSQAVIQTVVVLEAEERKLRGCLVTWKV